MLVILVAYLAAMIVIGLVVSRRVSSASDFLIAGRRLGIVLTVATFAALQLGAGVILGGSELAADLGAWPGMWSGIGAGGGLILAGILVASKLRRRGGFVPLDFFGDRYRESKAVRVWGWLSNIPSLLGIFVAQIMAAGYVFTLFGLSRTEGMLVSGGVVLVYSAVGGMWGAVVTDFIQLAIIAIAVPIVAFVGVDRAADVGVSAGDLLSGAFVPDGMGSRAVFIILPFLISISVSYDAYMRYQAARSESVARWGSIVGGVIVLALSFCVGLAGAAGRVLFPDAAHGDVFASLIGATLTPVFAGLVVSALLAASMSTANSLVLSLAGCFSRDLYNKVLHPEAELDDLPRAKLISRLVVVGTVVVGTLIALSAKGILNTMIIFNYPYMASMLVPLLGGVLWPRATARGAMAAMLVGGAIGVVCFAMAVLPDSVLGSWSLNIDLGLLIAYVTSAVVLVAVSLRDRPMAHANGTR